MDVTLTLLLLFGLLLLGVPVGFAMALTGAVGLWTIIGIEGVFSVLQTAPMGQSSEYILTTIPMFVLLGYVMSAAGITEDLYRAMANWLSWLMGGLGMATILASAVFGALSGASSAAAAGMAKIAIPNMREHGYSDKLSGSTVAVGSTLSVLIPPSIMMIVYGAITETSIGELLIAGLVPGILMALLVIASIFAWVSLQPSEAPKAFSVTWSERFRSLVPVWAPILLISVILLLLYSGVVTPTETGAVGALVATVLAFALRRITVREFLRAASDAAKTTTMLLIIIIGATIFGRYLTLTRIPQDAGDLVADLGVNRWVIMVGIMLAYFLLSMFMDELPLMLLTLPITFPLIVSLGFDPVWYGVMTMLLVAMGLVFPPVGIAAFIVAGTARIDVVDVFKGTFVLIIPIMVTAVLIMVFPSIALFLPSRL